MYIPILFYISYYKIKFLYIYIYTINSILLVEKKTKEKIIIKLYDYIINH